MYNNTKSFRAKHSNSKRPSKGAKKVIAKAPKTQTPKFILTQDTTAVVTWKVRGRRIAPGKFADCRQKVVLSNRALQNFCHNDSKPWRLNCNWLSMSKRARIETCVKWYYDESANIEYIN